MDFGRLLFSPEGRIGQGPFWMGFLVLFVFGILIHAVPVAGTLIWLLSTYCWVCLFSKRLHDMGHSGFLQVWVYLFDLLAIGALIVGGFGSILAGLLTGGGQMTWGLVAGGIGMLFLALCAMALSKLLLVLWLGLSAGQAGDNRYGPVPTR